MKTILIRVVDTFKYPGARYKSDGPESGEEFRETILEPIFIKVLEDNSKLLIDLDGAPGYAASFLDEAFGVLGRKHGNKFTDLVEFKCDDDPWLIDDINEYMKE